MSMSDKILEERLVPTNSAILRKTYTSSPETVKELQVPYCAGCGTKLKLEEMNWCTCGRSNCSDCLFWLDGKVVCRVCIKQVAPLSKPAFLVLFGIHNNLTSISALREKTHVPAEVIKAGFEELERNELIEARGFSIFQEWSPTNRGFSAVSVYTQVYGKDGDFLQMVKEFDGHVGEKSKEDAEHGD
jgi:hypothetical protein